MTELRSGTPSLAGPRRGALVWSAGIGAAVAAALAAMPFDGTAAVRIGLAVYGLVAVLAIERVAAFHPHGRFGLANGITMIRAAGMAILAGALVEPAVLGPHGAWGAMAAVAALLALDAGDGAVARRQGLASRFGARLDMEVDAALILVLSGLALALGKAGPWVLAIGLMRYGFVAAGWLWPGLERPLPPSRRRAVVCGVQVAILGALLAPIVTPPLSTALAAGALLALAASFGRDVWWLAGR